MEINTTTVAVFAAVTLAAALVELIRRGRKLKKALREARTDVLTGCGNKRDWYERVRDMEKNGVSFSFIMFDVGNLKAVNDSLGHDVGDRVLADIGSKIRLSDVHGYRIGGDEFIITIPSGTVLDAARLRDMIEGRVGIYHLAENVAMFISGAVGLWSPGCSLDACLLAADKMLTARKDNTKASLGLLATREESLRALRNNL